MVSKLTIRSALNWDVIVLFWPQMLIIMFYSICKKKSITSRLPLRNFRKWQHKYKELIADWSVYVLN